MQGYESSIRSTRTRRRRDGTPTRDASRHVLGLANDGGEITRAPWRRRRCEDDDDDDGESRERMVAHGARTFIIADDDGNGHARECERREGCKEREECVVGVR